MSQQIINIGAAPEDGTGDPNRTAFDKVNDNFTEVYAKGATEGLWNYNKTDTNTSAAPVSGRFKTNSGNYLDATQIAIHATTIQGIDRANTLRTMLVGDIIQCQDSLNGAAWCRYVLSSLPVDNGTWFQLNVTMQASGAVASGDNQEIVFTFTANVSSGGGGNVSAVGTPSNGQLAQWTDATHIQGIDASTITTGLSPPQGRLTLQTGTPVMTATQAAKTTIYYTPYVGNMVPIYDGSNMVATPFTELSVATIDTTKSPAAIGVSKINDWFVWNDAGTLRVGHGPDWTSDTARSAGTALTMVNGIWLNNAAITNGPAAQRGTYVGTTRSNASSQLDWIYGANATGGTAGLLGVWNAYNRVNVNTTVSDTTASWTYSSTTIRSVNASNGNRVSFIMGLAENGIRAEYGVQITVTTGSCLIGVALDSTSNADKGGVMPSAAGSAVTMFHNYSPQLGFHFIQAVEQGDGTNTATFSTSYHIAPNIRTQALGVQLRM